MGSILGKRNNEWLTGTARGLAVACGFNTHTGPNDRFPIMLETHEPSCKRQCVDGDGDILTIARAVQTTQTMATGYFAGYIVKVQPCGRYELKKCTDKMYSLRERIQMRTTGDQARAATRRMLTDLEQKGVLRGAVECFNLCVNLREEDSLFQECVRTFMSTSFPGSAFLHRLEMELAGVGAECVSMRIPATRRPNARTKASRAPEAEAYGFRDIRDKRIGMLSPFEFAMYWCAEAVLPPCHKESNGRSEWCPGGKAYYEKHKHDQYGPGLVAGTHYRVVEDCGSDCAVFPDLPALSVFRHRWLLVRTPRPTVPVFHGS